MDFDTYLRSYTWVKAFLKGPPGSGKTYLAAAATHLWKTLYVDVEGGLLSAFPIVKRDHIVVRLIKEPEAGAFFDRLADAVDEAERGQYECVVLDSITEVSGRMEDEYSAQSKTGKIEFGEWFVLIERIKRLARRLRDLKCHTIVTSLTKPTGKEEATTIFEPILPGQASATVPSMYDIVGLLRKGVGKTPEYTVAVDGPSFFQVRDRTRALRGEERVDEKEGWRVWEKAKQGLAALAGQPASPAQPAAAAAPARARK